MELKRIKKLRVNAYMFDVIWDKTIMGGSIDYGTRELRLGVKSTKARTFLVLVHELWEICAIEMSVRLDRPDCVTDFIFVYDHRQHSTMCEMFTGLITQFIKQEKK